MIHCTKHFNLQEESVENQKHHMALQHKFPRLFREAGYSPDEHCNQILWSKLLTMSCGNYVMVIRSLYCTEYSIQITSFLKGITVHSRGACPCVTQAWLRELPFDLSADSMDLVVHQRFLWDSRTSIVV